MLDSPVADVLQRSPVVVRAFIALNMKCIGCPFSRLDTLRQALEAHGLSPEDYFTHRARCDEEHHGTDL